MNASLIRPIGLPVFLACLVPFGSLSALDQGANRSAKSVGVIRLEVFGRGDSELSLAAKEYAEGLAARTKGLEVVFHDVLEDRGQLTRLWDLARRSGRDKPVVPAFYSCGQVHYGFRDGASSGAEIERLFTVEIYTRVTCSRCHSAKAYIRSTIQPQWPALRFRIYEIGEDAAARRRYEELCRSQGKIPGLPTLHFAGQVMVGYQGDQITGAQWSSLIQRIAGATES